MSTNVEEQSNAVMSKSLGRLKCNGAMAKKWRGFGGKESHPEPAVFLPKSTTRRS